MLAGNGSPVYEPFRFDASFQVREDRFAAEKQRIARAAAALVQEDETIGFTAGTTTTLVARQLLHRKNISIITNAVNIGMEMSSSTRLHATLTGGTLRWPGAFSLVGPTAIESLAMVVMDRMFLSATGVDAERGVTLIQPDEAAVFRAMVRQARQVIVVADSSKLGLVSPAVVCAPKEIALLITDNGISEEEASAFAVHGVKILAV
jgi:DeoR family transcriptional regulator of aga operon